MEQEELKYYAKIRIYHREKKFGPGVAELMRLVEQTGSIKAACCEMGMAYSKAWKMVKQAEEDLGFALLEGSRGGQHGGKTVLTEQGRDLLKRYMEFEREAGEVLDSLFTKHFYTE